MARQQFEYLVQSLFDEKMAGIEGVAIGIRKRFPPSLQRIDVMCHDATAAPENETGHRDGPAEVATVMLRDYGRGKGVIAARGAATTSGLRAVLSYAASASG